MEMLNASIPYARQGNLRAIDQGMELLELFTVHAPNPRAAQMLRSPDGSSVVKSSGIGHPHTIMERALQPGLPAMLPPQPCAENVFGGTIRDKSHSPYNDVNSSDCWSSIQ